METYERIKQRRLELGLSLEDVAKEIGVNQSTVMRYEKKSINKMPISVLKPLSKALHCSQSYLLCWTDDPTPNKNEG